MKANSAIPRVSILIPVFNSETFLDDAISSVRRQTFSNFEVVMVDDGSTDRSIDILRNHADEDPRCVIIGKSNGGSVSALNEGLKACRGEYIARLDSDDICNERRLERQVEFLDANPKIGIVGTQVSYFRDSAGAPHRQSAYATTHDEIADRIALGNCEICHPSFMIRREVLQRVGGYRECCNWAEDLDLYIRLLGKTRFANLPEVLLHYRQHPASVSNTKRYAQALAAHRAIVEGLGPIQKLSRHTLAVSHRRLAWCAEGEGQLGKSWSHAFRAMAANPISVVGLHALCRVAVRSVVRG